MNRCLLLCIALLAACSALPEQGPPMKKLHGTLTFRRETALPSTATAHVMVVPVIAGNGAKAVAQEDFPAKSGVAIPFELKIPAANVDSQAEYIVLAQIIDHDKVWYSNLSSPLRISFIAEPGELEIEMRRELY